jgi:hypothetical protein
MMQKTEETTMVKKIAQEKNFLIERKKRDQRLALVFESEQHLLETGAPINYHRYGILILENLPNSSKKSEEKIASEHIYSPENLVAFLGTP